jgi:hypothetical protein
MGVLLILRGMNLGIPYISPHLGIGVDKISCNNSIEEIDKILFQDNLTPVIIYPRNSHCEEEKDDSQNKKIKNNIYDTLNIIPRILRLNQMLHMRLHGPVC